MSLIELIEDSIGKLENHYISEAHLIADFYANLILAGINKKAIFLEYPYDFNRKYKCDIVIKNKIDFWAEVKCYLKTESPATRSRKHTHPKYTPFQAIDKLLTIDPEEHCRVLFIYQNVEYEPERGNSWAKIKNKCERHGIEYRHIKKL